MTRLLALITAFAVGANAITYWIDDTCKCSDERAGVDDRVMKEITTMAETGLSKLKSNDEVFNGAMNAIFKLYKADATAKQTVRDTADKIFTAIKGFKSTEDRAGSDVRIYCDNDAYGDDKRWRPVPDADRKDGKTNSKLPFEEQDYWDYINQITREKGDKGVQDIDKDGEAGTQAQTYRLKPDPDKSGQNKDRESITVADGALNPEDGTLPEEIGDYDEADPADLGLFDDYLCMTLFHEFTHLTKVAKLPGGANDPASWGNVNQATPKALASSADAYTFLAFSAVLNDKYKWRVAEKLADEKKGIITPIKLTPGNMPGPIGGVEQGSSTTQLRKRFSAAFGQPWLVDRKGKAFIA